MKKGIDNRKTLSYNAERKGKGVFSVMSTEGAFFIFKSKKEDT